MAEDKDKVVSPKIDPSCYVAPTAVIIGNVEVGPGCSIWDHATIRGDFNKITIEEGANIQEHAAVHVTPFNQTHIGKNVSVGHNAVVHAATIKEHVLPRCAVRRLGVFPAFLVFRVGFPIGHHRCTRQREGKKQDA